MEGYEVNFLTPEKVIFKRSPGGILTAEIEGESYKEVTLYRTFPHSMPYEYISVRDHESNEIGVIREVEKLESLAKEEAIRELHLRYLIPVVKAIKSAKEEQEMWTLKTETDRGEMTLVIQYPHDHIRPTKKGGLLLTDMEGRRCEIREVDRLDKKSLRALNKMI